MPNCCEPVLIRIWPGAWLNASVTIDLTMAMSSTTSGQMRQQLRQLGAALAVLGELELRPQQLRVRIDERGPIALEQLGRRQRAVELRELRLVVEQLQVARRPGHEQEDDVLRPRPNAAAAWRERIGRRLRRRWRRPIGRAQSPPGRRRIPSGTSAARALAAGCFGRDGLGSSWC